MTQTSFTNLRYLGILQFYFFSLFKEETCLQSKYDLLTRTYLLLHLDTCFQSVGVKYLQDIEVRVRDAAGIFSIYLFWFYLRECLPLSVNYRCLSCLSSSLRFVSTFQAICWGSYAGTMVLPFTG